MISRMKGVHFDAEILDDAGSGNDQLKMYSV